VGGGSDIGWKGIDGGHGGLQGKRSVVASRGKQRKFLAEVKAKIRQLRAIEWANVCFYEGEVGGKVSASPRLLWVEFG